MSHLNKLSVFMTKEHMTNAAFYFCFVFISTAINSFVQLGLNEADTFESSSMMIYEINEQSI